MMLPSLRRIATLQCLLAARSCRELEMHGGSGACGLLLATTSYFSAVLIDSQLAPPRDGLLLSI